jgi:DNA-binding XRE family transcriptional regulator
MPAAAQKPQRKVKMKRAILLFTAGAFANFVGVPRKTIEASATRRQIANMIVSIAVMVCLFGCATYKHTQWVTVENWRTVGIREVYYRNTGTTNWIKGDTSLKDSSSSETPAGMRNQDIRIIDN